MKSTPYITVSNVHLVEHGDRLHFHASSGHREDWQGPRDFDVTVRRTILDSRHGPRIVTDENIDDGEGDTVNEFYLADDWVITLIQDPAATHSPAPEATRWFQRHGSLNVEGFAAHHAASAEIHAEDEKWTEVALVPLDTPAKLAELEAENTRLRAQLKSLEYTGSTGYGSPRETWPDDTEINELIENAECFGDALFDIASKYGADVTNNLPRWQEGVFLREVSEFIGDIQRAAVRHKDGIFLMESKP